MKFSNIKGERRFDLRHVIIIKFEIHDGIEYI